MKAVCAAHIRRVVRVVEGAALEMLCGETHLGFKSLTLRQRNTFCQRAKGVSFFNIKTTS